MALGVITVGRSVIQYVIEPGWKTKQQNKLAEEQVCLHASETCGKKRPGENKNKKPGQRRKEHGRFSGYLGINEFVGW